MSDKILTKDELLILLDYFECPPHRLIDNYNDQEQMMRQACVEYKVEMPEWLKE